MKHKIAHNARGGFRFEITNPPVAGTEFITSSGDEVVFDEVSFAGMIACTRKSDGSQQLYFPQELAAKGE